MFQAVTEYLLWIKIRILKSNENILVISGILALNCVSSKIFNLLPPDFCYLQNKDDNIYLLRLFWTLG
jgi:hypothetical protein